MDKIDLTLSSTKTYPIIISNDVISRLSKYIDKSYYNRQIIIITQSEINQLYGNNLRESLLAITSAELINTIFIKAPLVGTFYISPKPESPPYIAEGDIVKEGQIICIIEAMKIFNEIEAECSGKIEKILVENSTPVEYDQNLFIIHPE